MYRSVSKMTMSVILLFSLTLLVSWVSGCSKKEDMESVTVEPPNPKITVDGKNVPFLLGSYQWKGAITDAPQPSDLAEHVKPFNASPSSLLKVEFDYKPNELKLSALATDGNQNYSEPIDGFEAMLPAEKGRFIYTLWGVWKEGHGVYVFVIDIK
ncbi:hypothetical protein PCCS19_01390 [Paenibacillus sp. CCS19]|uniref:hypothetical protein n=1 Tax=Paenibacillus sp. CCS19 TaxID=3158387 RepID=UPI00256A6083|nr:hypothetical protein [Paenibacillus cellulosilyticus]GMK37086.1 hypothetical protein PCCS19_01390 [Paenibacillus cellulosilyticus]